MPTFVHYNKSVQTSNNSASTNGSVVALTPEEEYSRYASHGNINKSSSLVFDRYNSKASTSSNLVHSYSTSAIVKNAQQQAAAADTTSAFTDSNFYQDGKDQFKISNTFILLNFLN